MSPRFQTMMPQLGIGTELIYAFVIILCCLIIYFATKELYNITKHQGIRYFRLSFLFFAIALFFRSFIKFVLILFNSRTLFDIAPRAFAGVTTFIFMYFSLIAIFYLLYSLIWKKDKKNLGIYLMHLLALVITIITILLGNILIYIILNVLILILILYLIYQKKSKKKSGLYFIYLLLLVFWIFNILDIFIPNFLQSLQLIIYFVSIGIFFVILYRVLTKIGSK